MVDRMFRVAGARPISKGPSTEYVNNGRRDSKNAGDPAAVQMSQPRQSSKPPQKTAVVMQPGGIRAKKGSLSRPQQQHQLLPESARSNQSQNIQNEEQNYQQKAYNQRQAFQQPPPSHIPKAQKGFQIQNINKKQTSAPKRGQSRKASQRPITYSGQNAHQKEAISGDVINYLKEEILQTWNSYMIPDYHRTVFLDCIYGLTPNQYLPIIAKEIEDLQQEQAPIQNTVRAIIARESCIQQVKELDRVLDEAEKTGTLNQSIFEECINILHSLRMLSLHVVKCIIEWRKQLIYSYLLTTTSQSTVVQSDRNSVNKFKNIPFIWESENYLLKMKNDTLFLNFSEFTKHFNFSSKSDPFLVYPSSKHNSTSSAVGGGAQGLKNLKKQITSQNNPLTGKKDKNTNKLTVPLPNSLMKLIRQSEVYLMEEAVTDQILKSSGQGGISNLGSMNYGEIGSGIMNFSELEKENASDYLNNNNTLFNRNEVKSQQSQMRYAYQSNTKNDNKTDIIDIKTYLQHDKQFSMDFQDDKKQTLDDSLQPISHQMDFFSPKNVQILHQQPFQDGIFDAKLEQSAAKDDGNYQIMGWNLHESQLEQQLYEYFEKLEPHLRQSFAPISILLDSMMGGYDPHYLVLKSGSTIQGVLAFNVDTMVQKQTEKQIRVNLYHITCLNKDKYEQIVDQSLEYIWKYMHCAVIRLSLYHYQDENGKLHVDAGLKNLYKSKGFKWKTVTNDQKTGQRVEVLECPNTKFKEQCDPSKCIVYRKNLKKEEINKEPLTIRMQTFISVGDQEKQQQQNNHDTQSICGVLNNLLQYKYNAYVSQDQCISNNEQSQSNPLIGELQQALSKAEKIRRGFALPDSHAYYDTNYENSMNQLMNNNIITLEQSSVQNSSSLKSFIGTSCFIESRFGSLDSTMYKVGNKLFSYMRIQRNPFSFASNSEFEHIIIIPNTEENVNFVILMKRDKIDINNDQVFSTIKSTLNNLQVTDDGYQKIRNVWIPQFKISQEKPYRDNSFNGFVVEEGNQGEQKVQDCFQQFNIELYGHPISEGTVNIDIRNEEAKSECFIIDKPFYLAITHSGIEDTLEAPLLIAHVKEQYWKLLN